MGQQPKCVALLTCQAGVAFLHTAAVCREGGEVSVASWTPPCSIPANGIEYKHSLFVLLQPHMAWR
jgi:hypothetical protein